MEARAIARYIRVTPRKANQVLALIRGKRVDHATELLDFSPKHVARVIGKVLKSAVANAVAVEGKINIEELRVKHATAGAGPTLKRFLPRAQGRATPLLKRTSHITIVVEGEALVEEPSPARRAARAKTPPKKSEPAKAEPVKPEPKKPESKKAEPKKAESKKPESKKPEPQAEGGGAPKPARRGLLKKKPKEA
jgi:large subunit ribosomal protein L22